MNDCKEEIDPLNKQWPQWLSAISACIGCFILGAHFSWSSPSIAILTSKDTPFNITSDEASWIASLMQFGAAFGPIFGSLFTTYLGPKICVLISSLPYLVGFILIILAKSPEMLYASRIISGLAVGLSFSSTPIYLSEIAENSNRGALLFLFSVSMSFGNLFMVVIAPYVSIFTMAEIMIAFPILMIATYYFAPESPYFYLRMNNESKAKESLRQLRRQNDEKCIKKELECMKKVAIEHVGIFKGVREIIVSPNPKAIAIVSITIMAQQLSGAAPAILYQEKIYAMTNVPFHPSFGVIITSVLAIFTGMAMIPIIDKWGRKPLLLISCLGCITFNVGLGYYYQTSVHYGKIDYALPVTAINGLLISYNIGLNPIPYTIAGEVFSNKFKPAAISIVSTVGALLGFSMTKLFQVIGDGLGYDWLFYIFAILTTIFLVIIQIFVPETKNKSFSEIQELLKSPQYFIPKISIY